MALSVLVKGRSSSFVLNSCATKVAALTIAASLMPAYCYVQSDWNPSDGASRYWEKGSRHRSSFPRRRRVRTKKDTPLKAARRNQAFPLQFDGTLGYPGEGPARKATIRTAKRDQRRRCPRVTRSSEKVLVRRTQVERMLSRKGVPLRKAALKPATKRMYQEAFCALWTWAGAPPPRSVISSVAYDEILSEYICQAWEHGLTRGQAGNALSASVTAYPQLRGRGRLPESRSLLNCWSRLEVPSQAPPLPALVAVALSHWLCSNNQFEAAFLILAGFDSFLTTRELLSLTWRDVKVDGDDRGVISLAHTKVGQRSAAYEASVINDPIVGRLFRLARLRRAPGTSDDFYIYPGSESRFYSLFAEGLAALELQRFQFRPYSLRRGGATAFYRATRNMQATIERGRWSTLRVARIYINDGLAKETELQFSSSQLACLYGKASALAAFLELQLRGVREPPPAFFFFISG